MLEKFLKGTYSFERQLGKNIVFSKDEIAIIHKRKAFWEKLVHIENLINLPYFSQINQSELNMLLGEKGFEANICLTFTVLNISTNCLKVFMLSLIVLYASKKPPSIDNL